MTISKKKNESYNKMCHKYELSKTNYKCVKTSLKSIVKSKNTINVINNVVIKMNKIVIHAYQFLKLYCIYQFNKKSVIPKIDHKFIMMIMKTVSISDNDRGKYKNENKTIKDKLEKFYDNIYKPLVVKGEKIYYTNLTQMLDYESKSIVTCVSNHIMLNFPDLLNRYINIICDKKGKESSISNDKNICPNEKKKKINKIRCELKQLKNDILYNSHKCDKKYDTIKDKIMDTIFKIGSSESLINISDKKPLSLIEPLIRMSIDGERIMTKRMNKKPKDERKLFNIINCFPLRKNISPKHVTFDTAILINTLMTVNKRYYNMNIKKLCDEIWSKIIKINKSVFRKKGYKFDHQIVTDGLSCSILFIRDDLYNPLKKVNIRKVYKPIKYKETKYVDELSEHEKSKIKFKTFVGIDPGVDDLIYATNGDIKRIIRKNGQSKLKTTIFRYSRMQRRSETKSRKYANIIENDKKMKKINRQNIKQIEDKLSKMNFNSCILSNVKKQIKKKNQINDKLFEYYEKKVHRQLKWFSHINRIRSESRMINRFKEKFGKPEDVLILMGDWSTQKNIRYKEPNSLRSFHFVQFTTFTYDTFYENKKYQLQIIYIY